MSLPLSLNATEDRLIWAKTLYGHYTTKSAYRILTREAEVSIPGTSNPVAHKQFWKELWSMNVQTKYATSFGGLQLIHFQQKRTCKCGK